MALRGILPATILAIALSTLTACDSAEQRAEKYYQSGVAYLQAGDVDRALVEFRNVFKLNGRHKEARLAYAKAERDRGNLREAYSQYLRLIEQYPDNLDGQIALAQLAAQGGNWPEAEQHVGAALALSPDDPSAKAVRAVIDYGKASEKSDTAAMSTAAAEARKLIDEDGSDILLRRVVIDDLLRAQNYDEALGQIDAAIALAPNDPTLYATRLSVFAAREDAAGVEAGLKDMVERFPDDPGIGDALIRWYVSRNEIDKAEAYMRAKVAKSGSQDDELALVQFMARFRGVPQAIAELDTTIQRDPRPIYRSARAAFQFDAGQRDQAIADMQKIVDTAPAGEETRKIKVALARMKAASGDMVGARALVEEVISEDSGQIDALKLKAGWLILSDDVGDAINVLRRALDNNPRDASVMTLMAQAYERDGNRDLMREMLSLAADASNHAPEESLRYAQFLMGEGKNLPAEGVLIDALRLSPGNAALLVQLGQLYVNMKDWGRTNAVADELDRLAQPETVTAAAGLRAAALEGQQKTGEAIDYLEGVAASGTGGLAPKIAIIRSHLANGDGQKALAYAQELLAENPGDPSLRFIDASVRSTVGDLAGAETELRALVAEDKTRSQAWLALYRLLATQPGRGGEAGQVIEQAVQALPEDDELAWAKAGQLERGGDIEGAIAVYEKLYEGNSANAIVANNLASLLSNYRQDPESLSRAELIARRLRGSNVGAYQDTYGWIAYQRGNYQEAATELSKAVDNLPEDPSVRYHLAMTLLSLGNKSAALSAFQKVVSMQPKDDTRAFFAESKTKAEALVAEGVKPAE